MHIVALLAAVAVSVGAEVVLLRVAGSRDVRTIRTVFDLVKPLDRLIPGLFVVGGVLGVVAAIDLGFNLLLSWLVQSYAVFAIAFVVGGAVTGRWIERVRRAAESSGEDEPSDELRQALNDSKARYGFWVSNLAIMVVIYIMVVKPFSYDNGLY